MAQRAVKLGKVTGKIVLALFMALVIANLSMAAIFVVVFALKDGMINEAEFSFGLEMDPVIMAGFTVIQSTAFILSAMTVYISFERRKKWPLGWRHPKALTETVRGMGIGIVLISLVFLMIWGLGGLDIVILDWSASFLPSLALTVLLFACVAVSEEFFSRGYVQGLIRDQYGTKAAIIVSSFLFTLLHALNPDVFSSPLPVVNLFLAGLLFGISREVSGGLWMPIGLHFTWNLLQGSLFGFPVSGLPIDSVLTHHAAGSDVLTGGGFGAEGSIIATVVFLVGTFLIYRFYPPRERMALY